MVVIRNFLLISLILFSAATVASIKLSPMPKPNSFGNIGILIVASDSPKYIEEWLNTPSNNGVTIKRLKIAKPNQLIVSSFLVSGVASDRMGNYSFTVSFYILGPNGKTIFGERDYAKGKGKTPTNPSYIMADPAMDLVLEESDPEGTYTIVALVKDLVTGKKADKEYKIEFVKK